ncbi:MAG: SpaH/EbpB family LPXTG-anchored major pilin [Lachnospiraceae bacterium]
MMRKLIKSILGVFLLAGFIAVPAMAAEKDFPASDQKGIITIHSFEVSDYANLSRSSGEEIDQENLLDGAKGLKDITFRIRRLDDSDGRAVSVNTAVDASFAQQSGTTDDNGKLVFANLPKGYYLLTQEASTGYIMQMSSFVVMLPMRNPDWSGEVSYNYDVHVYPKSARGPVVTKSPVDTKVAGIGDEVIWDVRFPVEGVLKEVTENGIVYAEDFYLIDTMDSHLDYVENSAVIKAYDASGTQLNIEFSSGVHYIETYDEASRTVTWSYTDRGVKVMADSNAAYSLARIVTRVNETAIETVEPVWNNAAIEFINASGDPYRNEVFSEYTDKNAEGVPKVHLGTITIDKHELDQETVKLAGVTFKVAGSEEGAKAGQFIQIAGKDYQIITDDNGYARFTGLGAGDYWLVETQAAEGYKLLENPVKVKIGETSADAYAAISIANEKEAEQSGTGSGSGTGLAKLAGAVKTGDLTNVFRIIGIVILAILICFIVWNKRQEKADQIESANDN